MEEYRLDFARLAMRLKYINKQWTLYLMFFYYIIAIVMIMRKIMKTTMIFRCQKRVSHVSQPEEIKINT